MARKNTEQAVQAWIEGKTFYARGRNGSPIWTRGGILYSYGATIGKWSDSDFKTAILNVARYSVTTSCQQGGVKQILAARGYEFIACDSPEVFEKTERK